jgi:hypothetical protein
MKKFIAILIATMYSIFIGMFLVGEIIKNKKHE